MHQLYRKKLLFFPKTKVNTSILRRVLLLLMMMMCSKKYTGLSNSDVGFFKSTLYIWNIDCPPKCSPCGLTSIAFWRQVCADIVLNSTYKKCSEFFFRDHKENTASKYLLFRVILNYLLLMTK